MQTETPTIRRAGVGSCIQKSRADRTSRASAESGPICARISRSSVLHTAGERKAIILPYHGAGTRSADAHTRVLTIIRRVGAPISALFLLGLCGVASLRAFASDLSRDLITLSIVGTTDVHGFVFPRDGCGGAALFGGYLKNLRASRARDGGAVLLVDSGDTFQGGIESDLSEGALVVDAYNALGYTAAAIGNHEFEFGPVDLSGARQARFADPRGALKARAAQATFPFLAANLIETGTGRPVDWPNVRPSVIVEAAGVKVGIIGVMTIDALRSTLPVNVH